MNLVLSLKVDSLFEVIITGDSTFPVVVVYVSVGAKIHDNAWLPFFVASKHHQMEHGVQGCSGGV